MPEKFVCTIGYHPNNYIIEDLGHSWGTSLKTCLGSVFDKGLIGAFNYLGTLHFQGFNLAMAFNGPVYPKKGA